MPAGMARGSHQHTRYWSFVESHATTASRLTVEAPLAETAIFEATGTPVESSLWIHTSKLPALSSTHATANSLRVPFQQIDGGPSAVFTGEKDFAAGATAPVTRKAAGRVAEFRSGLATRRSQAPRAAPVVSKVQAICPPLTHTTEVPGMSGWPAFFRDTVGVASKSDPSMVQLTTAESRLWFGVRAVSSGGELRISKAEARDVGAASGFVTTT